MTIAGSSSSHGQRADPAGLGNDARTRAGDAPGNDVRTSAGDAPGNDLGIGPRDDLAPAELQRYARQVILPGFGVDAQRRLANARVLVVGAGGLGSTVIPSLAAAGVGTLGIVDDDRVEPSNLPRQLIHGPGDVGRLKISSAIESLDRLNPATRVIAHEERITSSNALAMLAEYDLVVDGSDNFPTRYLIDDAATLAGIPSVWGAVHQFGGQVGVSWAVTGPTYRDLFPVPPAPGTVPSCEQAGVLPTVCVIVGGIMASETLKLLTGIGEPLIGKVTSYDARTGRFRELEYARDPAAAPITHLIDYELFCGAQSDESNTGESNHTEGTMSHDPDETDINAGALAELIQSGDPLQLLDVREDWEAAIASIDGSTLIPLGELTQRYRELDPDATTVVYCHVGARSEYARQLLRSIGFDDVRSLTGGIDAWSATVDPAIARY